MKTDSLFKSHRGPVTCAVEIPNTTTIITSGYDSAAALFNWATREVSLLGYHHHLVNRVTVNTSGTYAATASSDYSICIWDLEKAMLHKVLLGHHDDVEDFVFIGDNSGASVSRDRRIIIWDLVTGAIKRIILGHDKDVLSVNYFEDKLYTSGDDMTLRVWDINTGSELAKFGPYETETDTCVIDPINRRIVLGCDDGIVRVFDIDTSELLQQLSGHVSAIKKVAVSPVNGDILSAAYDQRILIWDSAARQVKQRLAAHPALWERSFNWTPDGKRVTAGTFDGTVLIWDAISGKCMDEIGISAHQKGNCCFNDIASMEDHQVVTVSDDGLIRVGALTPNTSEWRSSFFPDAKRTLMNAVAYDNLTKQVIVGTHDQKIHSFKLVGQDFRQILNLNLKEGPINSIRTSKVDNFLGDVFVGCYSGAIMHLKSDGDLVHKIQVHKNAVKSLRLHPSQPLGLSGSADGILAAWNYHGEMIRLYAGHTSIIDDIDIDPSGIYVASVGRDFTLKVHRIEDGVLCHSIDLGRRSPKAVCYYNTDLVIVTNYWGELLQVSLETGHVKRSATAKNGISSITVHDNLLAVTSYDGAIYLVDPLSLKVKNTLRSMHQKIEEPIYA